jgi:hypothetical protein
VWRQQGEDEIKRKLMNAKTPDQVKKLRFLKNLMKKNADEMIEEARENRAFVKNMKKDKMVRDQRARMRQKQEQNKMKQEEEEA